jgi:hypothetical protein
MDIGEGFSSAQQQAGKGFEDSVLLSQNMPWLPSGRNSPAPVQEGGAASLSEAEIVARVSDARHAFQQFWREFGGPGYDPYTMLVESPSPITLSDDRPASPGGNNMALAAQELGFYSQDAGNRPNADEVAAVVVINAEIEDNLIAANNGEPSHHLFGLDGINWDEAREEFLSEAAIVAQLSDVRNAFESGPRLLPLLAGVSDVSFEAVFDAGPSLIRPNRQPAVDEGGENTSVDHSSTSGNLDIQNWLASKGITLQANNWPENMWQALKLGTEDEHGADLGQIIEAFIQKNYNPLSNQSANADVTDIVNTIVTHKPQGLPDAFANTFSDEYIKVVVEDVIDKIYNG